MDSQEKSRQELEKELQELHKAYDSLKASYTKEISELKKAEETISMLAHAIRSVSESVCITDMEDNILFVNKAFLKTYGYEENELIGNSISIVRSPNNPLEKVQLILPSTILGGWNGELLNIRKDGTEFPVFISTSVIRNETGNPIALIGITNDITNLKKAEQEILATNEAVATHNANVTAIIEGTADSIWAFDRDYEIVYINQIFQKEFQQTFGVFLDPGVNLLESLPKPLQPVWKSRYDRVLSNERFSIEDAIDTGFETVYIQVTFNPIIKNGQVIGGSCFGSNITNRKSVEIELVKAKNRAEESDRLKSAFLANMSHEIRTPMNGILGFSELLKEPSLSGAEQQEYIRIIQKSGDRMLNIINNIVDISKIEAGLMKLNIKESNINLQIEYIYTFFLPPVEAKGMKLFYKNPLPGNEVTIQTDREKIYAILTNLVKNAIKFTDRGFIELGYKKKERFLEFYVKDTGIGIPKDRQEAIFERFIQADIEDKMAYQGAGLGLSISKAYVEMLGGKIWVESNQGEGSTFYFTIPHQFEILGDENSMKESGYSNRTNMAEPVVSGLKILIVEDDKFSEIILRKILKRTDNEILHAASGSEAILACRYSPDIDLIFMDIRMSDIDGYEATRRIRQFNRKAIIIGQSAYGLAGDREKAIAAGCDDYITKPIIRAELLALIERYFKS